MFLDRTVPRISTNSGRFAFVRDHKHQLVRRLDAAIKVALAGLRAGTRLSFTGAHARGEAHEGTED